MSKEEKQSAYETETGYKVGQNNLQVFGLDINAPVFLTSSLAITLFRRCGTCIPRAGDCRV